MKIQRILIPVLLLFLLGACKTSKQITYFQDLKPGESELNIAVAQDIKVRPEDKISIVVNSRDPQLTYLFNLPTTNKQIGQRTGSFSSSSNSQGVSCYTVNGEGKIDFPVLGSIKVAGMNRNEIATYIKEELISQNLVKDPIVTVEFVNLCISVLGEVNSPGRYDIDRDKITLLDALSMAGDLTIYGKREKVLVLREEEGKQHVYGVNLCSAEHLYSSPVYYLQQNDVIYVEPNGTKARQSTVNGNNVRSTSFWFSLASLLVTLGVLVFN